MSPATPPTIEAIIHDLRAAHTATTQGQWTKGQTTHHTVAKRQTGQPYRVAEFRHADDALFCDLAHTFMPRLLDEIERLITAQGIPDDVRKQQSK